MKTCKSVKALAKELGGVRQVLCLWNQQAAVRNKAMKVGHPDQPRQPRRFRNGFSFDRGNKSASASFTSPR